MKEVTILLVEDNEIDVLAFQRGMKKHRIANPLVIAQNGLDALQILRGTHETKEVSKPYVVFLDLNMPVMGGLEFLEELRKDPELDLSVVFVLSTSDHERDMTAAYKKHVAGYILKQNLGDACIHLHELMSSYWRVVMLP